MKSVEREVKILSHVNQIEEALDKLNLPYITETQQVVSVKCANSSFKLKECIDSENNKKFAFFKKKSLKSKKGQSLLTNKLEIVHELNESDFKVVKKVLDIIFSDFKPMEFTIEKKRYSAFNGYKIDVCQVIKGKGNIYREKFIEVEEIPDTKDKIDVEQLIKIIAPDITDVVLFTGGITSLSANTKKFSTIAKKDDKNEKKNI